MIHDASARIVIGNLGWVDKGAVWTFDLRIQTEDRIAVPDAQYLALRGGSEGLFRLVHHQSPDQTVSIRRVAEPARELASIRFKKSEYTFGGDSALWHHVDPSVIIDTSTGQKLLLIDAVEGRVKEIDLTWFTDGGYDLVYQGLTGCMMLSDISRLIVSVQRSSTLMVINPDCNKPVGSVELCNRGGNPGMRMRTAADFYASDYDTLCRLDARSLVVLRSKRLQGPSASNTQQFIGDYDFSEDSCVVARPFSGDVLLLDGKSFDIRGRARIAGQPLTVSLISESTVLARDWKTGQVAIGEFQPESEF